MEQPSPVHALIAEVGVAEIADALGCDQAAVRMWRHRRAIPRSVWPDLVRLFPTVTYERLEAVEQRSDAA